MNRQHFDIIILGGGPAAAAAALGLLKLNYRVALVTLPRPFAALEGISRRVIDGLKNAGLAEALHDLPPPSLRQVCWNGETSSANQEVLVDRQGFDQRLVQILSDSSLSLFQCRAGKVSQKGDGWQVELCYPHKRSTLHANFLVEARGRSAPRSGENPVKGPATLSLLHYWQGPPVRPHSAVQSFRDGWAWLAAAEDGRRYLQLTLDGQQPLPEKSALPAYCEHQLHQLQIAAPFLRDAKPGSRVHARTSGSVLPEKVIGNNWIRIGDAALAADPLSGNGIFQALSSALSAPAVINSLIRHPTHGAAAQEFHRQRIEKLFYRFCRTGRDFYRQEQRWPNSPFWQQRRQWPDNQPLHQEIRLGDWEIAKRPVVDGDRIRYAETLVNPDQPLGIWHLEGIELAAAVRLLRNFAADPENRQIEVLSRSMSISPDKAALVTRWAHQQRVI